MNAAGYAKAGPTFGCNSIPNDIMIQHELLTIDELLIFNLFNNMNSRIIHYFCVGSLFSLQVRTAPILSHLLDNSHNVSAPSLCIPARNEALIVFHIL